MKEKSYFSSSIARWYWIVLVLSLLAVLAVYIIPEDDYPIIFVRQIFGFALIFILPGYSLTRALSHKKEMDSIETIVQSLGISVILVAFTGFILNYTTWGIKVESLTLSIFILIIIISTIALLKEKNKNQKKIDRIIVQNKTKT